MVRSELLGFPYFLFIAVSCVLLMTPLSAHSATATKFSWKASESGPVGYPMQVVKGDLYYPEGGSLYIPDRATLYNGWGIGNSSHIVAPELKPLPSRLEITFFSYLENQFYYGDFEPPYEEILKLFQEGYYSQKQDEHVTYRRIVVGIAPGGLVSVWLRGVDRTTEVFFSKAEKRDVDWKRINDNPKYSRDEYVRLEIEDSLSSEEISVIQKNGIPFGLWEHYRPRYDWQPEFINMELRDGIISYVGYFNGENGYLNYPLNDTELSTTRAVPKEMSFVWDRSPSQNLLIELYFDESEIFPVFEKLGKNGNKLELDVRIEMRDGMQVMSTWIKNAEEEVKLLKTRIDHYGAK